MRTFRRSLLIYILVAGALPAVTSGSACAQAPHHLRIYVTTPQPDQTYWNTGGKVRVVFAIRGTPPNDSTVSIELDGQVAHTASATAREVELINVWRGTHKLIVKLTQGNAVLAKSQRVRFFVHQHSVLGPAAHK